jgi:hypothetical protein
LAVDATNIITGAATAHSGGNANVLLLRDLRLCHHCVHAEHFTFKGVHHSLLRRLQATHEPVWVLAVESGWYATAVATGGELMLMLVLLGWEGDQGPSGSGDCFMGEWQQLQ